MEPMQVVKLKDSPKYNEAWLQEEISVNPALLRIGKNLRTRDKERVQQFAFGGFGCRYSDKV